MRSEYFMKSSERVAIINSPPKKSRESSADTAERIYKKRNLRLLLDKQMNP